MRELGIGFFALAVVIVALAPLMRASMNASTLRESSSVTSKSPGGGILISPADVVACRFYFEGEE